MRLAGRLLHSLRDGSIVGIEEFRGRRCHAVAGIGNALGQAHRAVEGDITGVTENLGVAFNSTFIALVISIVLMFFIHQLQLQQERLVLDSERYVDRWFVRRLRA